ncbi:MAG: hypothetical protein ACKVY0_04200 [Prosthecobacter sp.]|uniref:hypothetical protein n=1 Tax=Prosthecobacter sp. TaxID=1965333 RepID=UPI0038FDC41C
MSSRTPPSLLLRIARRGIVGVVCLSLGMHWALLQGIAWTGMLISFAREGAVIEAVEKTFDGQHGCALCAKVKEGRDSDQQRPQQTGQSLKKMDAVLVEITKLIAPAGENISFVMIRATMAQRNERPEMPPPRCGLA